MGKSIGILTAGGDSPGLNAAIRAIGKAAIRSHDMNVIGFRDGFRGLMQQRYLRLDEDTLSGILTRGGTILGTSREKPHRMDVGGTAMDMPRRDGGQLPLARAGCPHLPGRWRHRPQRPPALGDAGCR